MDITREKSCRSFTARSSSSTHLRSTRDRQNFVAALSALFSWTDMFAITPAPLRTMFVRMDSFGLKNKIECVLNTLWCGIAGGQNEALPQKKRIRIIIKKKRPTAMANKHVCPPTPSGEVRMKCFVCLVKLSTPF